MMPLLLRRLLLVSALAGIWILSDRPQLAAPPLFPHQDKLFHALEYAALGLVIGVNRDLFGRRMLPAVLAGVIWAGLDEIHQSWVPGRDCSTLDFLADMAGLAIWLALARWRPGRILRGGRAGRGDEGS
jgi:VanZ family protein